MENSGKNKQILNFHDLIVYQNLYKAMKIVNIEIIPTLPREERFDLVDQMRRASKAAPALIAEGFAKRFQIKYWSKYLNDTIGECNEMIHHLSVCKDIYGKFVNSKTCDELINLYTITCKQLTKLGQSWRYYHTSK
ncbi:four helix bundle protein [Candidatus Gottesmanbacteria bacterium]|nr:four helix bundle protein [Candidatus Gottesmanbacteria bacterium]